MEKINILFWNIQKKDLTEQIKNLCIQKDIHILILAENIVEPMHIVQSLNISSADYFTNHPLSQCDKITIISKFHFNFITPIFESNRITIRELTLPLWEKILLVAVHLIDKGNHNDVSQSDEAINIVNSINSTEENLSINKSIIIGDFNMNPFEAGMIKALGFHATMSSNIAKAISRTVQNQQYKYFYNPMWSLYGDLHKDVAGSYYYHSAQHVNYDWNIFDQVLLRPDLIANLVKSSLEIVTSDGVVSLIDQLGRPDKKNFSDHLPIFFTLNR